MSDFTSDFWSLYVAAATLLSIAFCAVLLVAMSKRRAAGDAPDTGHTWDGDLAEYNNPLPRWWVWLFWITILFGLAYLVAYPGLGTWQGTLRWSSADQYVQESQLAESQYGPIYQKFAALSVQQLSTDPEARVVGEKLFLNYCSQCHASDGRGARGFPNLTDADWLYGGEPATIEASILDGRNGVMPPMGAVLGPAGSKDAAHYVRSLSGLEHDKAAAERGKATFMTICSACHGADGKGNVAMGAPNLTDAIWLYGSSEATLIETIMKGRTNRMPAHREFLGEARAHVVAGYVYGLSRRENSMVPVKNAR